MKSIFTMLTLQALNSTQYIRYTLKTKISHTKNSVNAKYDRKRNIAKGSKRVKEIKSSNQTNKKIIAEIR